MPKLCILTKNVLCSSIAIISAMIKKTSSGNEGLIILLLMSSILLHVVTKEMAYHHHSQTFWHPTGISYARPFIVGVSTN